MNSVDLSEVLLDEMVILDREPFKDKDDMFNVMTRQFETAGLVSDAGAFKKGFGISGDFGADLHGQYDCHPSREM